MGSQFEGMECLAVDPQVLGEWTGRDWGTLALDIGPQTSDDPQAEISKN